MMKRKVSLVVAAMMLFSMLQIGTAFAADIIDVQTTGLTLPDESAYDVATLDESLAGIGEPNGNVTVSSIDFQEYQMTFDYQTTLPDTGDITKNLQILIGKDSIRFTPMRTDTTKGDIMINSAADGNISATWSDRLYDIKYSLDHATTESYHVYLKKSGAQLTIGIKGPGEADYSWAVVTTYANDAGATLQMNNSGYGLAVTNAKVYLPKGEGPVEPEPQWPIAVEPQVGALPDADLSGYTEKTLDDSSFSSLAQYTYVNDLVIDTIDFQNYVFEFDYQINLEKQAEEIPGWGNLMITIGSDVVRLFPMHTQEPAVYINSAVNADAFPGNWDNRTHELNYPLDGKADTKYHIYLRKNGAELTAGIKKDGETEYSWTTLQTAANEAGATLKMVNNYYLYVTNAKVYVPRSVMPEVDLSGYEGGPVEESYRDLETVTWSKIESKIVKPAETYVMKFQVTQKMTTQDGSHCLYIYAGNDVIKLFPANSEGEGVWHRVPEEEDNWTSVNYKFPYALANDLTTTYDIYMAKSGTNLVFGIKKADEANYEWFQRGAADGVIANDGSSALAFNAAPVTATIADLEYYVPKVETPQEPMPEVDTTDYESVILDQKTIAILAGTDYSNKDATFADVKPTDYVLTFDFTQKKVSEGGASLFYIFAGNDVIKLFPKDSEQKDIWWRVPQDEDNWTHADLKFQYDLANDATDEAAGTTGTTYEVYMSKTGAEFVFGIREKGEADYAWFKRTEADGAVANDGESALVMQTFGFPVLLENVRYLQPAVDKGPMPEVTDFTDYDKAVIDSSLLNGLQGADYTMVSIPTIQPTNYVMKFQYRQDQAATESNQLFWIYAGNDVVKLLPYEGTGIWHRIPDPENYPEPDKGILSEPFDAQGYKHAYAMKNDTVTTYDIYMSKFGTKLVFGIKEATQDTYEWFEVDGKANTGAEELTLTFRTFAFKSTIENLEYYVPKDYVITDETYTDGDGTVTVSTSVTRQGANTKDKAIFVTAVYQTAGGAETLYSLQATEETALSYNTEVPFTNTVSVPESGQYTVKSYLWNSFTNMVPIAGEMSKAY